MSRSSLQVWPWLWTQGLVLVVGAALGCSTADGGPAPADTCPTIEAFTGPTEETGVVRGRVVDSAGDPLVGVKLSFCTRNSCRRSETICDGRYTMAELPEGSYKVGVFGEGEGYMSFAFVQRAEPGEIDEPEADIVVPAIPEGAPLPSDSGGSALLADGQLEITAGPESIAYPIGVTDEEIFAVRVPLDELPPYGVQPWAGREPRTRAFFLGPYALELDAPVDIAFHGSGATEGDLHDVWVSDHAVGTLVKVGIGRADAEGTVRIDPGSVVTPLTTLVLVPRAEPESGEPAKGAASGRVVNIFGQPQHSVTVLACTDVTCIRGATQSDGRYFIDGLGDAPHKMQLIGTPPERWASIVYHQSVIANQATPAIRPVTFVEFAHYSEVLDAQQGGTVLLDDDRVSIEAQPGTVRFPVGEFDQLVNAVLLDPSQLPPHDIEPWTGLEAGAFAVVVNPVGLEATEPFGLGVHGLSGVDDGSRYEVWVADAHTACLEAVGTATADADGNVRVDDGSTLVELSTIVFVPTTVDGRNQ